MLNVMASLFRALAAAALATVATASVSSAVFVAPAPGEDLQASDPAGITLTQDGGFIQWVSDEQVAQITTLTWPVTDGADELGGALAVETVYRTSGSLTIGEPPKTVVFQLEG
jgi:hypothetical protein